MTRFSFEFFPPRGQEGLEELGHVARNLVATNPNFMTVTYGAGGSSQDGSLNTLQSFRKAHGNVALGAHLTYIASPLEKIEAYTDALWQNGVKHIVALRGDAPKSMTLEDAMDKSAFSYTSDFVKWLKNRYPFEISVGAYPEKHPDASCIFSDIDALKMKCDAGADRALTQFFFDNDVYFRFIDHAQAKGITTPILPGVLPIMHFSNMAKFANKCESSVPKWLADRFDKYEDGSEDALKEATDVLTEQVEGLIAQGVPHIHFYTMNSDKILPSICKNLSLNGKGDVRHMPDKSPKYGYK